LREWRTTGRTGDHADTGALRSVERVSNQLRRLLGVSPKTASGRCDTDTLCRLLLSAYPDRVARLREADEGRYLLANGRGARLATAAAVTRIPLLIAVSVAGGEQGEGVIHLAESISEELLRAELDCTIETREEIIWDSREGRITAGKVEFIGAVRLSSTAFSPGPESLLPVVIEAVRASGLGLLSRGDSFFQLQARMQLVRQAFPGDGWPDPVDAALLKSLEDWLAPFVCGVRNAQQLAGANCAAALLSLLDYRQRQSLDELAPTHVTVPSGSRIRLDYCSGELPVLAVKLQELFGLAETPTIAGGRVAVLLHLLSPGGRTIQVTRDLKGFWDGSYHQVKKELKGRYPKHPWPDDPWSALPTRRAKPKGT
jgi:ATP-dependent helicase HrpB